MKKTLKKGLEIVKKSDTPDFGHDPVVRFLFHRGSLGATNFEMMMKLHMCDVRKRISVIRSKFAEMKSPWRIIGVWFESDVEGKRPYKRYFLMKEALNETKRIAKSRKKRITAAKR